MANSVNKKREYKAAKKRDSVKWQVEHVLKSYVACRSNDLLLYVTILNRYYGVDIEDDRLMLGIDDAKGGVYPSLQTVSRTRRKFQERGWFTPKARRKNFIKPSQVKPGRGRKSMKLKSNKSVSINSINKDSNKAKIGVTK